ncbi:amidohydrolase family protein [Cellulosimicrobium funkei]|nr:amidohydrolase family protein [Cellulosimicrobium funkei]
MSNRTIITNVLVMDADRPEGEIETVVFSRGFIESIGEDVDGTGLTEAEDTVVDGIGRTLIPGLIDAHLHAYASEFDGFGIDSSPTSFVALQGSRKLREALYRGFTTVRDVAGGDLGLQQALLHGVVEGPDYLFTGPALSQTGGHGDGRTPGVEACAHHHHMGEIVDGADNVRRVVRERLRSGAHAIKVMASGGVASHADPLRAPQYSLPELEAAAEEAERFGSYVTAHAYTADAVQRAVRSGIRCIEHGNLIDDETIKLMVEEGAALVPTLIAYDAMGRRGEQIGMTEDARQKNAVVLDKGREAARKAHEAGVSVGFGSDLMGDLDDEQLAGLRIHVEVLGLAAALRSATAINARILGLTDRGRLAPGLRADAVLLGGDLRQSPAQLWDPDADRQVYLGGRLVGVEPVRYQRVGT